MIRSKCLHDQCVTSFWRLVLMLSMVGMAGCSTKPEPVRSVINIPPTEMQDPVIVPVPKTEPAPRQVAPPIVTNTPPPSHGIEPAPVAPAPQTRPTVANPASWTPLDTWASQNGLSKPKQVVNGKMVNFLVSGPNGTLKITIGSQVVYWNGTEIWLGFQAKSADGHPYLNALDVQKSVRPLFFPSKPLHHAKVIVIDPGHGGSDNGSRSIVSAKHEKDYTLDVSQRLEKLLVAAGWKVFLTRTADSDIAVTNRVVFAEKHHADLFLSVHFNSYLTPEQQGIETYCLTPVGMTSNLTRGYEDNPRMVFPNNVHDEDNFHYAINFHRALLKSTHGMDRGVRRARFMGVIRAENFPAILVECGFLSNPREAQDINTAGYRQKIAQGLANALLEME